MLTFILCDRKECPYPDRIERLGQPGGQQAARTHRPTGVQGVRARIPNRRKALGFAEHRGACGSPCWAVASCFVRLTLIPCPGATWAAHPLFRPCSMREDSPGQNAETCRSWGMSGLEVTSVGIRPSVTWIISAGNGMPFITFAIARQNSQPSSSRSRPDIRNLGLFGRRSYPSRSSFVAWRSSSYSLKASLDSPRCLLRILSSSDFLSISVNLSRNCRFEDLPGERLVPFASSISALGAWQHAKTLGMIFGAQPGTASGYAWLFIVRFAAHFPLESTSLDQLAEAKHRLVDRLAFSQPHLNHTFLLSFRLRWISAFSGWGGRSPSHGEQRRSDIGRLAGCLPVLGRLQDHP